MIANMVHAVYVAVNLIHTLIILYNMHSASACFLYYLACLCMYALFAAIKAYCFGSHKKGRSRGPVEEFPMRTMHVQWQAERAPPNVYGDPDPNETADVGDEESNLQEKGEQITLE